MAIVVVGAGPNLGAAVARRFGREGMPVGLISRDAAKLAGLAEELGAEGLRVAFRAADIRDADGLSEAIASLADELGPVEVLEYSPTRACSTRRSRTAPSSTKSRSSDRLRI
jgi:short-subunit dehydrogenase